MRLSVYSIQNTIFEGEITSLTLPTPNGEITVLDGHLPLISLVNAGNVRYADVGGVTSTLSLHSGGVLEVRPESDVVILANA